MYGQKRKKSKAKKPKGLTYAQVAQEIDKKISALQQRGQEGPIQQKTVGPLIQKLLEDKEALRASQEEARTKMYQDKVYAFQKKFQEDMLGLAGQAKYGGTIPKAEYGRGDDEDDFMFFNNQMPFNENLLRVDHSQSVPLNKEIRNTDYDHLDTPRQVAKAKMDDFFEDQSYNTIIEGQKYGNPFDLGTMEFIEEVKQDRGKGPRRPIRYNRPFGLSYEYGGAIPKALFGIKKNRTEEEQAFYDKRNKALLDAGLTAAPTLYNLGRGFFEDQAEPVMSKNPYAEDIVRKGEEAEAAINPEAQIKENRKYLNFLKYLNKKKGSGSSYMGTVTSGLDKMGEANRKALLENQKEIARTKSINQRTLLGLGEADAVRQEKFQDLGYKIDEQNQKLIGEGLTGVSDLHQNKKYMDNLMKNDFMKALIFDKYLNDPSGKGANEVLDKFMKQYFSEFLE